MVGQVIKKLKKVFRYREQDELNRHLWASTRSVSTYRGSDSYASLDNLRHKKTQSATQILIESNKNNLYVDYNTEETDGQQY